jgi:hypothetical protein
MKKSGVGIIPDFFSLCYYYPQYLLLVAKKRLPAAIHHIFLAISNKLLTFVTL